MYLSFDLVYSPGRATRILAHSPFFLADTVTSRLCRCLGSAPIQSLTQGQDTTDTWRVVVEVAESHGSRKRLMEVCRAGTFRKRFIPRCYTRYRKAALCAGNPLAIFLALTLEPLIC